jgi:RNA 2',3'-cyclic 3'-phosphodiesterase
MRLFVAVDIDAGARKNLDAVSRELRRRVSLQAPGARVTWVAPDRLHLTVRFIGETDERVREAIATALGAAIPVAPFEVSLAGVGAFPSRGAPRVLWTGIGKGEDDLRRVEREVDARLRAVGIDAEARPFHPHLTLARVRDAAGLWGPTLLEGLAQTEIGTTHVEAITLFESRLSPRGPTHEARLRTPLRG